MRPLTPFVFAAAALLSAVGVPTDSAHATVSVPAVDRAAFVRDFRADFPEVTHSRTDRWVLAQADAVTAGIRAGATWAAALRDVDHRFGVTVRGPEVLSLIASQLSAGNPFYAA